MCLWVCVCLHVCVCLQVCVCSCETHGAVVEQVEQGDEEGSAMLAVGAHLGEQVRAECCRALIHPETSDDAAPPGRLGDGLLYLVRHLHPCYRLHLGGWGGRRCVCVKCLVCMVGVCRVCVR